MQWVENHGVRWLESDLPSARAIFTTRVGGHSGGSFASLNLGLLTDDDRSAVMRNRHTLIRALGIEDGDVVSGRQVHGSEVLRTESRPDPSPWLAGSAGEPPEVDGHATGSGALAPLVYVADCLPVALSGSAGIAMLHCGWRGLAAGIVARGAGEVQARAAAIGPGIGPCCFEVGPEVTDRFADLGDGISKGRMLDLPEVCERLLRRAGVEEIDRSDRCTFCEEDLFFSHRRDQGRTGRQAGMVIPCPN